MLRLDGKTLHLSGAITTGNYARVREAAAAHVGTMDLVIDWSAVDEVDSSAVALILSWQRDSTRRQVSIENTQMPESLTSLVALYGLTHLVSLAERD